MRAHLRLRHTAILVTTMTALLAAGPTLAAPPTAGEPVAPEVASPSEVPADLLTAPDGILEAVAHQYYPGDNDPASSSGAVRWRIWARHFPEAASWAEAHPATAEWAHHFPDRARWALENPGSATFVVNHPDVLEWEAAHPAQTRLGRERRQAHPDLAVWDELTGRSEGALSDAAMAAATAPEATPGATAPPPGVAAQVPAPGPTRIPVATPTPTAPARFQVVKPRFEVRKPPATNVIARRPATSAPVVVAAPPPQTVIVHETATVPVYQPAPVVLYTAPQLRYQYRPRPRIVIYPTWGYRGYGRGGPHGRGHGRGHRRWW